MKGKSHVGVDFVHLIHIVLVDLPYRGVLVFLYCHYAQVRFRVTSLLSVGTEEWRTIFVRNDQRPTVIAVQCVQTNHKMTAAHSSRRGNYWASGISRFRLTCH
jgi:hypothetical protein